MTNSTTEDVHTDKIDMAFSRARAETEILREGGG